MAILGAREGYEVKADLGRKVEWDKPGREVEVVFRELTELKYGYVLMGWDTETGERVYMSVPSNLKIQLDNAMPAYGDVLFIRYEEDGVTAGGRKFKKFRVWLYPRNSKEVESILEKIGLLEKLDLNI